MADTSKARALGAPPATFVATRRSTARSVLRLLLLVSLGASLCLLVYALFRGAAVTPISMALTVVVCMLAALATEWKLVIRIGADGIRLGSAMSPAQRFIPYARLARVDVEAADVWLALDDGKRIGFGFGRKRNHVANDLAARVREQLSATRSIEHPFAAVLGRGSRSPTDWLGALAGRSPDSAYREVAIPPASLLTTIEDGDAPADIRLGAAVALRRVGLDDIGRARVRVASQLTRDPKLRVGLARSAEDDEEALAVAVDAFCDEKAPASKRRA
jgi:hypothetical protein